MSILSVTEEFGGRTGGINLDPAAAYAYGGPVTLAFDVFDELDWTGLDINLSLRLGL